MPDSGTQTKLDFGLLAIDQAGMLVACHGHLVELLELDCGRLLGRPVREILVGRPRLVDRPSRLVPGPSEADRSALRRLTAYASTPRAEPRRVRLGATPIATPSSKSTRI